MTKVEVSFQHLPTTAISDATGGHTNLRSDIKPLADHFKIAGRAVTVRLPDGENGAVLEAIRAANEGDILVIDAKGNTNRAVAGDFVISLAKGIGVQGFVVDGVIRDIEAIRELNFPIFSLGTTVAAGNKNGGGQVNVPIAIGGVTVLPGDYIIGDVDGVIVVPQQEAEKIVAAAEAKLEKDEKRAQEAHVNGKESIIAYLDKILAK
ncbi:MULTISPECIES: RraA family protein [Lysinibacillus]|jgi:RraA family protein|uniref:RraA family protein n=1 Tax=Lysinibacillus TaxID=400634 RepID=UPI000738886E|nr:MULTISPECIES: RraA family protein [unclassified Lysinibacillus]MEE3809766.1 RraA family protein [Lysinibacillus fusiformis]KUF37290.1 regulator [Lysinibacillus sp. F5]WCH47873.1 RraA family protein [Lysinibacillus sp. OF-1]WKT77441.1 RraA family protein [Lysinibacillus fusiformis]SCZ10543.1 RraA famliy [Lysinibacillus sp. SG9]